MGGVEELADVFVKANYKEVASVRDEPCSQMIQQLMGMYAG